MGAHDEDDFLCATPPSATDAYTQLDGQRFSDPQDSQGRPRTSDAAVAAVTGSRSSGACWLFRQHESHADAPMRRISYRGGLPPPCTALRPARGCSRAVQPLESRRGDLPTPRLSTLFSLAVNVVTLYSPVHEHRAGGRIGVVAVRPRASFARGEQLAPHSPRLRSTFPLIHVSGQANSEHDMEALGGMWGCTTRRCQRWRSAAWWVGGEARGVPGSSCRSARGGRRLWVGLGSLAMRPAVSKIQNLTHSDPAMRRIRGLRVPCCCVERASPKSQRLLRYAVFRLLKLPLPMD